jgi:Esterase/lipase
MDGSASPILRQTEPLNREYRQAIRMALRDGVRPADPLAVPLWNARRDAMAWHFYWQGQLPDMRRIVERSIPGPVGPIPLRLYYPHRRIGGPLAVYFHGGGFALNGLATHERLLRDIALRARVPVCAVGYSLAPEHRFPVQWEEAVASVRWIMRHAGELGVAADRIALLGDSAGANLALATACALRDSRETPAAFLALFYGMFSADLGSRSHRMFGNGEFGLSTARVRWFWEQYVADPADRSDPRAAPLQADVEGLPPTLLIGAGLDCLLDDTLRLADRLRAAGVAHVLSVYDDLPHSFATIAPSVRRADEAVSEVADAVRFLKRPAGHAAWVEHHLRQKDAHRRVAEALSGIAGTPLRLSEPSIGDAGMNESAPRSCAVFRAAPTVTARANGRLECRRTSEDE